MTCQVSYQCHCYGQAQASILYILDDLKRASVGICVNFLPSFWSFVNLASFDDQSGLTVSSIVKSSLKTVSFSAISDQFSFVLLCIKALSLLKTSELLNLILPRLDILYEKNLSWFCSAAVQLLLSLKVNFPQDFQLHQLEDKIQKSKFSMDKQTNSLWQFYLKSK